MKRILAVIGLAIVAATFCGLTVSPALAAPYWTSGSGHWNYTISLPVGDTKFATYITTTTARLNAYIDSDGGDSGNCQVRFQFYTGSGSWTDNQTGWVTGYSTGDTAYADVTGLTTNALYYYRAEIMNPAGTCDASAMTFSAYAAPTMPASWFLTPDYTRFRRAFFYGMYNLLADRLFKMPRNTFYMLATYFWCVVLAVAALIIGKRLMPALIVLTGSIALAGLIRLLPLFNVAFVLIFAWGIIKMGHPQQE